MEYDLDLKHRGWSEDDISPPQTDRARFPGDTAQSSPGHCSGQRGRCSEVRTSTLHYTGYDSVLLKTSLGTASPVPQWKTKHLPKHPALKSHDPPALSFPWKKKAQGRLSQKGSQRRRARVGRGRENEGKLLSTCTPYWSSPAGEQQLSTWVCSHKTNCWPNLMPLVGPANSLLTINRLERNTSSPLPSLLIPSSAPALHRESENPLIHWVTLPLETLIFKKGPLTKCTSISKWCGKAIAFQATWALLKKTRQAAHIPNS